MGKIKFGTDGWRAIIAKEYTIDNLKRISEGAAKWMQANGMSQVVIGYDCRFGGKMFSETSAGVFAKYGIKVILSEDFSSTPMVSLGIVKTNSDLGIVITASHNPPSYNGFKLKSSLGGPSVPKDVDEVEALIPDIPMETIPSLSEMEANGLLQYTNLEDIYIDHVKANFDLEAINNSSIKLVYDAMFGAGQNVIRRLFPDAHLLHCEINPSFKGIAPEPISRNLQELSLFLSDHSEWNLGLATDGDADRIGMYNEDGRFVDSHQLLLLLLLYQFKYKGQSGKVVVSAAVTDKLKKMADSFGLETIITKIGFKYIAEIMITDDVLVGGEESGGLSVKGHIPERDGIWIGIMIMEFMAQTGKSIKDLMQEVNEIVGTFAYDRDDLHLSNEIKERVVNKCKNGEINAIAHRKVDRVETTDGFKYFLDDDSWLMVRPSGTEPVLRVYAQAKDDEAVRRLLEDAHKTLQS